MGGREGGVKRNGGTYLRRKFIAVLPSFFFLPLVEEEKRGRGAAGVQALACRRESFCGGKLACLPVRDGDGWVGVGWVGGSGGGGSNCPGRLGWRRRYGKEGGHGGLVG